MTLLREALAEEPELPVVMITAHGTVDTAVEALKSGRVRLHHQAVRQGRGAADRRQGAEDARARRRGATRAPAAAPGRALRHHRHARQASRELYADPRARRRHADHGAHHRRERHRQGARRARAARALVAQGQAVHQGQLRAPSPRSSSRASSSATSAARSPAPSSSKPGRFELANGGTLFLDEIGEIPDRDAGEAPARAAGERVRAGRRHQDDPRRRAPRRRDEPRSARSSIAAGSFREDLFYRLNVVPIRLPALRERAGDIPLLVEHFLAKFNERLKKNVDGIEPDALERRSARTRGRATSASSRT